VENACPAEGVVGTVAVPTTAQDVVGTGVRAPQFPDVHVYPDGHVLPQAPQLAADVVGSMQASEQEICGGVQDVAVGSPKSERSAEEAVLSRAVACPCHFCGEVVVDRW